MFIKTNIQEFLNEGKKFTGNKLVNDFIGHYYNNKPFNIDNIPTELVNKFPKFSDKIEIPSWWKSPYDPILYSDKPEYSTYLYAGVNTNREIGTIKSWTMDMDTAFSFSEKYENGKVVKLTYKEFLKKFDYFISMDVIHDYIYKNKLNNSKTDDYVSESEIVVLGKITPSPISSLRY